MKQACIEVPAELKHPFFFPDGSILLAIDHEATLNLEIPFMYEAAFFSGIEAHKPWLHSSESISALLTEWEKVKEAIRIPLQKRDKRSVIPPMRKGIGLFLQFLHWANGQPTKLCPEIAYHLLEIKPVNVQERLDFVMERPGLHHSYMQLRELMIELEKGYEKSIALKKRK